jgi:hypothetical protein
MRAGCPGPPRRSPAARRGRSHPWRVRVPQGRQGHGERGTRPSTCFELAVSASISRATARSSAGPPDRALRRVRRAGAGGRARSTPGRACSCSPRENVPHGAGPGRRSLRCDRFHVYFAGNRAHVRAGGGTPSARSFRRGPHPAGPRAAAYARRSLRVPVPRVPVPRVPVPPRPGPTRPGPTRPGPTRPGPTRARRSHIGRAHIGRAHPVLAAGLTRRALVPKGRHTSFWYQPVSVYESEAGPHGRSRPAAAPRRGRGARPRSSRSYVIRDSSHQARPTSTRSSSSTGSRASRRTTTTRARSRSSRSHSGPRRRSSARVRAPAPAPARSRSRGLLRRPRAPPPRSCSSARTRARSRRTTGGRC